MAMLRSHHRPVNHTAPPGHGNHDHTLLPNCSGCVVDDPKPTHMSEKSAFRRCGRDLGEFFNNTGWALYVQVVVPIGCRMLPDFPGVISYKPVSG